MTELDEVAANIAARHGYRHTLAEARELARSQLPDETPQVIDGVAAALVRPAGLAEAFKFGDVRSGNWRWAVGIPSDVHRHTLICEINTTACLRQEMEPEAVARAFAEAYNSLKAG